MYLPSCPRARTTEKSRLLLLFVNMWTSTCWWFFSKSVCFKHARGHVLYLHFQQCFPAWWFISWLHFFSQYLDSFFFYRSFALCHLRKKKRFKKRMCIWKVGSWLAKKQNLEMVIISRERAECSREKQTWAQPLRFLGTQSRHLCLVFSPRFSIAITLNFG